MRLLGLLFLLSLAACAPDEPPPPDVGHLMEDLNLVRFEQELMSADTNDLTATITRLDSLYPGFSEVYFRFVIPIRRGDFSPEEQVDVLKAYLRYPLSQEVYQRSQASFASLQSIQGELESAVAYFNYYLPDVPTPDTVVTFVSQFEYAGFLFGENQVALGLDMFLGPDFDYKSVSPSEPIFSDYLTRTYTPEHLTSKAMQLLIDDLVQEPEQGRLIDYMVYNGKKLWLLDHVLPTAADSVKLEINAQQAAWLTENEAAVYIYLQSEELLYETDLRQFRKYIDPSPNSPGMPEEAPGRSANFLGWKIVEAWMNQHPDASVKELLSITDGQRILSESRYKPSRF